MSCARHQHVPTRRHANDVHENKHLLVQHPSQREKEWHQQVSLFATIPLPWWMSCTATLLSDFGQPRRRPLSLGCGYGRWGRGASDDSPRNPNVHISGPRRFKHHQNSTKRPPRERRKKEHCGGRGKKVRNFGRSGRGEGERGPGKG